MTSLDKAIQTVQSLPAVYLIVASQGRYLYKRSCRDLRKRLQDHRTGRVSRTKHQRPLKLGFFEYCNTYTEARRKKNYLKTGAGREYIKECLNLDH